MTTQTHPHNITRAYHVRLHGRLIDTVFAVASGRNRDEREDDQRRSLITHDGYDPAITVREQTLGSRR